MMRTLNSRLDNLRRVWEQRHPVKWPPLKIVSLAGGEPTADEQAQIAALETSGHQVIQLVVVPGVQDRC